MCQRTTVWLNVARSHARNLLRRHSGSSWWAPRSTSKGAIGAWASGLDFCVSGHPRVEFSPRPAAPWETRGVAIRWPGGTVRFADALLARTPRRRTMQERERQIGAVSGAWRRCERTFSSSRKSRFRGTALGKYARLPTSNAASVARAPTKQPLGVQPSARTRSSIVRQEVSPRLRAQQPRSPVVAPSVHANAGLNAWKDL